jgi:hypothetical protein
MGKMERNVSYYTLFYHSFKIKHVVIARRHDEAIFKLRTLPNNELCHIKSLLNLGDCFVVPPRNDDVL